MSAFGRYVAGVIGNVVSSHAAIRGLGDRPGDLDAIRREWSRASGLIESLAARIEGSAEAMRDEAYRDLARRCRAYGDSYAFGREIDVMAGLYAEDPGRLRNMRLKVAESLEGGGFLESLREAAAALGGGGEGE